ncbi:MAG: acetoacetate metabolism regulatory protein AtoC [uncultured bacterium]|nr:MAG: acetoacetate metabolism regulatory protein AtoC [uncultured bacterium]
MNKNNIRILIVDDEANILEALKTHLELEGYSASTANSAATALELFNKQAFQIVITDINMPVMDGLGLLEEIIKIRGDTTVIMMTAYTSLTKVLMSRIHGAFDYILKPFKDLDEINYVVERASILIGRWEEILEETKKLKATNS